MIIIKHIIKNFLIVYFEIVIIFNCIFSLPFNSFANKQIPEITTEDVLYVVSLAINKCSKKIEEPQEPEIIDMPEELEEEEPKEEKIYLGNWRITEYCKKCNKGYLQTASGNKAQEWYTCAVSHSNYKKLKGCCLYIENWGYFKIQDWGSVHGCDPNEWVDIFLPTSYHNKIWEKQDVFLVKYN